MNQQPDRTEAAYRAALGVMVEDTPPAPEWEDLLPTYPTRSRSATSPRRGWAVALVAAGLVLVLVGGIAIVNAFGGDPDVAEEPTPTTQAPAPTTTIPTPTTTTPTTVPTPAQITAPDYADVPSFTGTVQYYEHDPTSADPGWQATVTVSFAGPMLYEVEVVAEEGEYLLLGGAGKVYRGLLNEFEFEDMPPSNIGVDLFRHLYYDSDRPWPAWDEICGQGAALLGTEALLGRTVTHVACSTSTENHELWVDEESGLVLRMAGPLSIGDGPRTAPNGGFTFTELTFEPVVISEMLDIPTHQPGEFPPFHMIRTEWPGAAVEYWYQDADTLRQTFIEGEWIDSFTVISEGRLAGCFSDLEEQGCSDVPLEDAGDIYPGGRPYRQVPISLVEESCTEVSQDIMAGRPARHFTCDGLSFGVIPYAETWHAVVQGPHVHSEYWFDTETDLLVKTVGSGDEVEVTLLEVNPAFPVGIFEYEEMVFPSESGTG